MDDTLNISMFLLWRPLRKLGQNSYFMKKAFSILMAFRNLLTLMGVSNGM